MEDELMKSKKRRERRIRDEKARNKRHFVREKVIKRQDEGYRGNI